MVSAHESNEKGHWEHRAFHEINIRLLARFDGWWGQPPVFPSDWLEDGEVLRLTEEAEQRIQQVFGCEQAVWGWKEPRTTLTLPFWRRGIPGLRFIVCVRNPLDAAASLQARDRVPMSAGVALWHWYTETALRLTQPGERILIHYEDLLIDYRRALAPVLEFCGLSPLELGSTKDAEVRGFLDVGLNHHFFTFIDAMHSSDVLHFTRELYWALVCRPEAVDKLSASASSEEDIKSLRAVIAEGADHFKEFYTGELPGAHARVEPVM